MHQFHQVGLDVGQRIAQLFKVALDGDDEAGKALPMLEREGQEQRKCVLGKVAAKHGNLREMVLHVSGDLTLRKPQLQQAFPQPLLQIHDRDCF